MPRGIEHTWVVILAGGAGTRFWPLSTGDLPKQFLRVAGDRSMIQATFDRAAPLASAERTLVVAAAEHRGLVGEHLPDLPAGNILGEPSGRNTAPAVAWAMREILSRDPDGVMLVLSADHHILNPDTFRSAARRAVHVAEERRGIVLFGLTPEGPKTQYGYILPVDEAVDDGVPHVYPVARFHEKPPAETARRYLAGGPCFWNSGMFCWRADTLLEELTQHAPDVLSTIDPALRDGEADFAAAYAEVPSRSIDHAVVEHTNRAYIVDSGIDRVDLGTWSTVSEVWPADEDGNVARGDVLALDSRDTVHYSDGAFLATIGTRELVIVVTPDSVLVCDKNRVNDVGDVARLVESARDGSE